MDCGLCLLDCYSSNLNLNFNNLFHIVLYGNSQSWSEEKIKAHLDLSKVFQFPYLWKIIL